MTALIIFITIYIVCAIYNYRWIQKTHYHPQGVFYGINPENIDILMVVIPILNLICMIYSFLSEWKAKKYIKKSEFFKPRKPFKEN